MSSRAATLAANERLDMKTIAIASLTAGALTAAALGLAGNATAFPGNGSAEDTINALKSEGYKIQLNGSTNNQPLSRCTVEGLHPILSNISPAEKPNTTVFVDIVCPDH
jgi:ABC-type phosphate transport system substrate-binding protein